MLFHAWVHNPTEVDPVQAEWSTSPTLWYRRSVLSVYPQGFTSSGGRPSSPPPQKDSDPRAYVSGGSSPAYRQRSVLDPNREFLAECKIVCGASWRVTQRISDAGLLRVSGMVRAFAYDQNTDDHASNAWQQSWSLRSDGDV